MSRYPKILQIIFGSLLVVGLGFIEYMSGPEISFSIFYLIPIALISWFAGRNSGLYLSFLAGAIWFVEELTSGNSYSRPWIIYWNSLARLALFISICLILSQWKKEFNERKIMSEIDFLTGAINSRHFLELALKEIAAAKRNKYPLTLAYIDLDNFKDVNDKFGHTVGDEVLRGVVRIIRSISRPMDIVARMGGDEFVIMFPETGLEKARKAIQRIQEKLLEEMKKNDLPVTFSIGVAIFMVPPDSVDEMIRKADGLMYSVKKNSKNMIKYEKHYFYGETK